VDKRIAPDFSRLRSRGAPVRFIFSAQLFSAYISAAEFMTHGFAKSIRVSAR